MDEYSLRIDPTMSPCPAQFGLIWAEGIHPQQETSVAPEFLRLLLVAASTMGEEFVPAPVRQRVRTMLRHGKYKPSGRSKPASEFLLQAALRGEFPLVNGPVDVNNAISLESGFPGSIFDVERSGQDLMARRGAAGESYVFNPSGQTIDLEDLLLVCHRTASGWCPCGNPVKDAMATKISATTGGVVAVLYIPMDEPLSSLEAWCVRYADLLTLHCGAARSGWSVIRSGTQTA